MIDCYGTRRRVSTTSIKNILTPTKPNKTEHTFQNSMRLMVATKSESFFYDELGLKPIERPWTLIQIKT